MKLLILHASAGGGHRRAAEALAAAALERGADVVVRDTLDFVPPLYRRTYAGGYLALVRTMPELWGYLYAHSDRFAQAPIERKCRVLFNRLNTVSFLRFLSQVAPDAVLCTHFLPLELLGPLAPRRRRGLPLYGVLTDFDAHSLWYCPGVDGYYVATAEARRQLSRWGQPEDSIKAIGIPVLPVFAATQSAPAVRARIGLDPNLPAVLVLAGGFGVGPTLPMIRACLADPPPCQLVVVTGHNGRIETEVRQAAKGARLPIAVYGFVDTMHELMDAADLIVTKPGGLTVAEALAKGKPLILVDPIPGQEQRNGEHLLEAGCAVRLHEPADASWKIRNLLDDPQRRSSLAACAQRMARPFASREIIEDVLARGKQPPPALSESREILIHS